MYVLQEARKQFLTALKPSLGGHVPTVDELETPPDPKMGDLAYPCFELAKAMGKSPAEVAKEVAKSIEPSGLLAEVMAVGPYVNARLGLAALFEGIRADQKREKRYGASETGAGTRVMVEYFQPNTHKQLHVGHLRSFVVGQMAADLLAMNGFDVIPVSYINDLGAHVAKCLWAIRRFHADEEPAPGERDAFLQKAYVEATEALEGDPSLKEEVAEVFRELEAGKGDAVALWKKTRKWSLETFKSVQKELGIKVEKTYYESDLIVRTGKIVDDLLEEGIAKESEGAVIVDFEDEGLGVNLLRKSDGTFLYNAKDLALAMKKDDDYEPKRSVYVVDARQALAMKQLFATLRRAGFDRNLSHLSFDFVRLKEGAMSSRRGTVVLYEDFRDEMIARTREETRARHPDWDEKRLEETSRAIAFAAMRFGMLRQDLNKEIVFDMEEAASFDGFTGPYLLYTYARMSSILRKAGKAGDPDPSRVAEPSEARLLAEVARFPDAVREAGADLKLSLVAHQLFGLAKAFAEYYEQVPVISADEADRATRLATVEAAREALGSGLRLLGIEPVEEM